MDIILEAGAARARSRVDSVSLSLSLSLSLSVCAFGSSSSELGFVPRLRTVGVLRTGGRDGAAFGSL